MMPYSPAARGIIAKSSAYVSAPASDSSPATSHTVNALPGVPTLQVITRAFKNTPVPMTFATLTAIAAIKPRPRTSWPFVSFEFGVSGFEFILLNYPQITQITQKRKLKELRHKKAQEAQNEIETSSQSFIQADP